MHTTRHFHLALRHATMPTYVASYIFPLLFVVYEIYRVGSWVAVHGMNFTDYRSMGFEFTLMLGLFVLQMVVEVVFLFWAALSRHHDFEHRIANLLVGMFCSVIVIGFDYALQYAM